VNNVRVMEGVELKASVKELGLSPQDFARLAGVTPRAVSLWVSGERAIPGPLEAYLRSLKLLPPHLRQVEFNRLKGEGSMMRDGMYGITFQSPVRGGGAGLGALIFDNGRVYGSDSERVRYDGEYIYHEATGLADVKLKVTFPPNVMSVFGVKNPYEWAFDVTATIDPRRDLGDVQVRTSIGQAITAQFRFLRSLPESVAA